MILLDASASAAIGIYQRYLSPHKGFCCAYRVHTGRRSCSAYALGIVERVGALALFTALPRQFARCKTAALAVALSKIATEKENKDKSTKDDSCDRWADGCDVSLDVGDIACDCSESINLGEGLGGCAEGAGGCGGCSW